MTIDAATGLLYISDFWKEKNDKNVFPPDSGSLSPAKQHTQIYQNLPSGKASFSIDTQYSCLSVISL